MNMVLSVMYPSSCAAMSSSDNPRSRDASDKLSTDLLSSHSEFSESESESFLEGKVF